MDSLLLYVFMWVIVGGRLGYVLFYNPWYFWENSEQILAIWHGWMSFHGGFVWVLCALWIFSKRYDYQFFEIADILAICIPVALGLWRIGNWINQELPGYAGYNGVFAMQINGVLYFPSPLLQASLEGIVLTIIMIIVWRSWWDRYTWRLSSAFLIWYATMRLIAEWFRLPDEHIGYLLGTWWLTLGIVYTLPMLIWWIILFWWTFKKSKK